MLWKRVISLHPRSWSLCRQYLCTQKDSSSSGVEESKNESDTGEEISNLNQEEYSLAGSYKIPTREDGLTEGTFMQIPKDLFDRLFGLYGFTPLQKELFDVLDDTSIMVREPYLKLVDYVNRTDLSKPANRYILCKYLNGQIRAAKI